MRVSKNRVRRKILGPKRDGVAGEWRRLHDEEFYDLYSPNIIPLLNSRRMSWAARLALTVSRRGKSRGLVGKPEGKSQFGRPRCRWERNVKIYDQELERGGMGLDLA